jgi:hypothetical protein
MAARLTPDGREVWAPRRPWARDIAHGSTLDGHERPIYVAQRAPVGDIAKDGRVAPQPRTGTSRSTWLAGEGEAECGVARSLVVLDISPDGQQLLMSYSSEGPVRATTVCGTTRGGDATRIGEERSVYRTVTVLSVVHGPPSRVTVLPIGPGDPRTIPTRL